MDRRLYQAAWAGDLIALVSLATEDPRILHSSPLVCGDNPLHIACMANHHNFVKELIRLKRDLADELNGHGLSPLHIAAANGDLNIVKELLNINKGALCKIEGKDRCIPLHCAVIKGRLEVVKELIVIDPHSIEEVTSRGETVLHLAIKNNQFKTLQILVDYLVGMGKQNLLRNKDHQGNTILHLATSKKQYEVIHFFLSKHGESEVMVDVNAMNEKGQTPLDVLLTHNNNNNEVTSSSYDKTMEDILIKAGAQKGLNVNESIVTIETNPLIELSNDDILWYTYFKYKEGRDSPGDVRNCLLVIVALIATATYQAILSPPGGAWQEHSSKEGKQHIAGRPIMQTYNPILYGFFLYFNTLGFCTSLYMIKLLTSGFPLLLELYTALGAILVTYEISIATFTPRSSPVPTIFLVVSMLMPITIPFVIGFHRRVSRACGFNMGEPNP
ncbi:ankyrin repeat-containing protein BDA1-like [Impatiens glandulifera]|uniref:ankyrin repeat-containing protein BDA1-like n=1 Tax=Impatiens glandulifera TaxID=253017 RepID=UPI001FB16D98|nr:ankyrin repeat-containing protein BDA1-like [Impatiens glandulifera]